MRASAVNSTSAGSHAVILAEKSASRPNPIYGCRVGSVLTDRGACLEVRRGGLKPALRRGVGSVLTDRGACLEARRGGLKPALRS